MPDYPAIHKLMQKKHQTLIQLWEEYREMYRGKAYSYSQFTYYYREFLSKVDICMRQVHYAGEIVFVDYAGKTIPYWDNTAGETKYAQVFVGVMGCSNYTFAFASKSQKLADWIDAHNQLLFFLGGVPQVVVPDNLKSAVTTPGKDLLLNETYQELAEHYGCVIVPARVRRPQDKSKAEIGVKLITQWISMPLSRRKFFSVEEINTAIQELLPAFNQRSFRQLPGCRQSRFEELDKPVLKPLPDKPYEYGEWLSAQKVGPDYHLYVKGRAYSVPWRLAGEKVEARVSATSVAFYHLHKQVALHPRDDTPGETTTNPNRRPADHQAYASQSLEHYLDWAYSLGTYTQQFVKAQFHGRADFSIVGRKACSQLQKLTKHYGEERVESACHRAIDIGSPTVKSVRSILQHRLDECHARNHPVATQLPNHGNVRGSSYYDEKDGDSHE